MKKLKDIKIAGLSLPLYTALVIILAVVIAMGKLPLNMVGITFTLVVLGHLFYFLGERLPFWNTYLGGGSVFTLLLAAILASTGLIPRSIVSATSSFMSDWGFLDLYCSAYLWLNSRDEPQTFGESLC